MSVSSELAPLAQTGGLGDAVSGLAHALADRGHKLYCALPAYAAVLAHPECPPLEEAGAVSLALPDRQLTGRWLTGMLGPLELHLLDLDGLYDREGLYGGADEALRFIAFARSVAARCAEIAPDVLVAHDWQAALSICTLRTLHDRGRSRGIGTLQVVHNNAHQGRFPDTAMGLTGLPGNLFATDGLEFHGELSLLKGGLAWADRIVAVSPSYAVELGKPAFGEGLEGLYRYRSHRLVGIANGIDTLRYDPACDPALAANFDSRAPQGRAECRKALLEQLGLESPEPGRLLTSVGRLAVQKGWDVIAAAVPRLVENGATLALLGSGDAAIAARMTELARSWPRRVFFREGWDDTLARRLYAGADAVLVPSRFEPCGLVQLLAQRYGALPIAHAVGGLRDTIRDGETGILFPKLSVQALVDAVERGVALQIEQGPNLIRKLLRLDVSWKRPAAQWAKQLAAVAAEAATRV
jgi:starch synthase